MRVRITFAAALLALGAGLLVPLGCSGRSRTLDGPGVAFAGEGGESSEPRGGGAGRGGSAGALDAGLDADSGGRGGRGGSTAGSAPMDAAEEPYVDPGCPDAAAPPGVIECDLFSTPSGCGPGLACKPSISHPYGQGCDQQTFSQVCRPAGSGAQGEECLSASDCADGFICVVGAGAGKLCLRMCALDGSAVCPAGYVCGETDAQGVGVCA